MLASQDSNVELTKYDVKFQNGHTAAPNGVVKSSSAVDVAPDEMELCERLHALYEQSQYSSK